MSSFLKFTIQLKLADVTKVFVSLYLNFINSYSPRRLMSENANDDIMITLNAAFKLRTTINSKAIIGIVEELCWTCPASSCPCIIHEVSDIIITVVSYHQFSSI